MLECRRRERALLFGAVGANTLVYTGARVVNGNRERICLSTAWDDAIPFLPWTILVYWGLALVLWGSGYLLAAKQDKAEANRFFLAHLLGEGVCFLCFVLFPATLERPYVTINGPFSWMVQLTYVLDPPDNLLPSIHCFVSWLCHLGARDNSKAPLWYRRVSFVSAAAVCVSTLTVKQHVLADAAAGIALAQVSFWAAGHLCPHPERIEKTRRHSTIKEKCREDETMNKQVILIVEDEPDIREGIRILLEGEGYLILEAESGEQALRRMNDAVDLVILDIMLPGISGLKVCEELRQYSTVPILFLTAKTQESDKTIGLTAGGDDYLSKPFSYAELIARVKALLRRYCVYRGKKQSAELDADDVLTSGRLKIVWIETRSGRTAAVNLTETEYRILALLVQHPHRIFPAQVIYESVWNEPYTYSDNSTIMVHIRRLRTKIEDNPQNPAYIKNIWGKGYRYETEKPMV